MTVFHILAIHPTMKVATKGNIVHHSAQMKSLVLMIQRDCCDRMIVAHRPKAMLTQPHPIKIFVVVNETLVIRAILEISCDNLNSQLVFWFFVHKLV